MKNKIRPSGMTGFTIIWIGQMVSLLGSGMTTFGVSIWAWDMTGQATALALAMFFGFGPQVLLSPLAGAIVDRYDRKLVMMLSDLAAGVATIVLLLLYANDSLQIWHLYAANAFSGAFGSFQFPAYSAAVSVMIPKQQYGRANGMIALAGSASGILAPIIGGALYGLIGLGGIMTIDIVTFVFAIGMLLFVFIPAPETSSEGMQARGSLRSESMFGFKYIFERPSLLGLQLVFFFINFSAMLGFSTMVPMVLARTGSDSLALSFTQSIGAIGGVVGGILMSVWGGPRRRVHGVLMGMISISLLGSIPTGIGRSVIWWAAGGFFVGLILPVLNGSNQAIWQAKVQPDIQGRVFAVRRLIAQIAAPIGILSAGPLADLVFEPAMAEGGAWADTFGWLVGTGPGAGMGLMFVLSGFMGAFVGLMGYAFPKIRNVEDIMPDHDAVRDAPVSTAAG